jgi:1-acyl-sn-glycerol-3-phosphate acyltransferase
LLRAITPGLTWRISGDVRHLRSSVIVCNHRSYLDPILFVSLFPRQKTIVKSDFFNYPVFGWLLKASGYLPSTTGGALTPIMLEQVEKMRGYLASGGVLFVFPEAHRSRDGKIGDFNKGVFSIARRCGAPIDVLVMKNTEKLFPPGRFLFNTCVANTIEVRRVGHIEPDYRGAAFSLSALMAEVRSMMESRGDRQP